MKTKNSIIRDYLGNEIKDGMTIKIIRTKPMFVEMQMYAPNNDGIMISHGEPIKIPDKIWETVCEYKITKDDDYGLLCTVSSGDGISIMRKLSGTPSMLQQGDLITISGVSDTEPEQSK